MPETMTPAPTPVPASSVAGPLMSPLEAMQAESGQHDFTPPPGMRPPPGVPPGAIQPADNPTSRDFVDKLDAIRNKVAQEPQMPPKQDEPPKKESARESLSWKPKKSDDWKTLKGIANQNQNRVAELEAELAKLKGTTPQSAEKPIDDPWK